MIWHNSTVSQISEELQTDIAAGLSSIEAKTRLIEYGQNEVMYKNSASLIKFVLSGVNKIAFIMLIIVSLVNLILAISVDPSFTVTSIVVMLVAVCSTLLIALTNYFSERMLEQVSSKHISYTTVIRDNKEITIKSTELVPGDIMLIKSGDYIKADGRLIDSYALTCDENMVSGDMAPSEKMHNLLVEDITPLQNRRNMVYSGSYVLNGKGVVLVTSTGLYTESGMRKDMQNQLEDTQTPLSSKLFKIKHITSITALISSFIIFFLGIISNFSNTDVSFAVTVSSNLLLSLCVYFTANSDIIPSIIAFSRAFALYRLRDKNIIINSKLTAEELKDITVICTDKTGVLTTEELTVVKVFNGNSTVELNNSDVDNATAALLRLSLICSNFSRDEHEEKHTNNIEHSIEKACIKHIGASKIDIDGLYPKIAELPFNSDRMLMTTVTVINGSPVSVTKGAPEVVLAKCSNLEDNSAKEIASSYAKEGLKVIAIAIKQLDDIPANPNHEDLENDLTFIGVLGIEDEISSKAAKLCNDVAKYGIKTIMVTGDHIDTAIAISKKAGIIEDASEAICGEELAKMSDDELKEKILDYSVFARIQPGDKLRIVEALKSNGEKVLITGDSVNDTQALLEADFGCALGNTASDMVKDSADLVIDDNHYSSIILAIFESANIYINAKKALMHLLSVGLSLVLITILGLVVFGAAPLSAAALTLIGFIVTSFPLFAIFTDCSKKKIDFKTATEKLFNQHSLLMTFIPSTIIIILGLIAYGISVTNGTTAACGAAFTVLCFGEIANSLCILKTDSIFNKNIFDKNIGVIICLAALIILLLFVTTPIGAILSVSGISLGGWILSILVIVLVITANEILKVNKNSI